MLRDLRRYTFIDGLRGIAALLVLIPHNRGIFNQTPDDFFSRFFIDYAAEFGARGVQIFFVISGFVIAASIGHSRVTGKYVGNFILRRVIRLDPPYWAAIVLSIAVVAIRRMMGSQDAVFPTAPQVLSHLMYVQWLFGYEHINLVFWTLCVEVQFYLVYCFLLYVVQKVENRVGRPLLGSWVLPALFVGSLLFAPGTVFTVHDPIFLKYWFTFLSGALLWHSLDGALSKWVSLAACVSLLGLNFHSWNVVAIASGITGILIWAAIQRGKMYSWLSGPKIQFAGKISYSLYLVHVPVSILVLPVYVRFPNHNLLWNLVFFSLSAALSISLAYLSYRFIEAPSTRFSKRFKLKSVQQSRSESLGKAA